MDFRLTKINQLLGSIATKLGYYISSSEYTPVNETQENKKVVGDGVKDNSGALALACANYSGFYLPAGTYLIGSNLTINKPIRLAPGAKFLISSGVTLTITKGFDCGLHHCFSGDGNVIFKGGSVYEAPIQWFGAVSNPDSRSYINDISVSFTKALTCGTVVKVPTGYYYLAHTIILDKPCYINFGGELFPADVPYPPNFDPIQDVERNNRTVIYTNFDVDFFLIKSRSVWGRGGTFDASNVLVNTGTKAVFKYLPQALNEDSQVSNRESWGMRQGGFTDFLVVGNAETLKNESNGIIGIYIDWINADKFSYMYRHIWKGYMEHVKYGLYESEDGGKEASNSCWHEIELHVWVAKRGLYLRRSTENTINISFQSAPVLHENEKHWAAVDIDSSYGNYIKARFVDMFGSQSVDASSIYYEGWYHRYTKKDATGRNFYVRMNTDVDITNRQADRTSGAADGISLAYADGMSGVLPSGQYPNIYEGFRSAYYSTAIVAADKRYTTSIGYYKKPTDTAFTDITTSSSVHGCTPTTDVVGQFVENLWTSHTGFTEFFWLSGADEDDYVEIVIDGIDISNARYNELHLTGQCSLESGGGFKQIHVVEINAAGTVVVNTLVNCKPSISRSLRYSIPFNDQEVVKTVIIRFIGFLNRVGTVSAIIEDFSIFKPYNGADNSTSRSTAALVSIAGNQAVYGDMEFLGGIKLGTDVWNSKSIPRIGNTRFWFNTSGKMVYKNSEPANQDDGFIINE
jgi:hypothetical protein